MSDTDNQDDAPSKKTSEVPLSKHTSRIPLSKNTSRIPLSKKTSSVPLMKETVRVTLKAADAPPAVPSADIGGTKPPSPKTTATPVSKPPEPKTAPTPVGGAVRSESKSSEPAPIAPPAAKTPEAPKAPEAPQAIPAAPKAPTAGAAPPKPAPTIQLKTATGTKPGAAPTIKLTTSGAPIGAPLKSGTQPGLPGQTDGASPALPKATVQLPQPTQPLAPPGAALQQASTFQLEQDENEEETPTIIKVLSAVGLAAALAVLATQALLTNTWVSDETTSSSPGWGRLFE